MSVLLSLTSRSSRWLPVWSDGFFAEPRSEVLTYDCALRGPHATKCHEILSEQPSVKTLVL